MDTLSGRAGAVAGALERSDLDLLAYLPSNSIAGIIGRLRGGERPRAFPVAREEEAIGIIGGANLAGGRGAVLMQDNGFGNALTALATWAVAYHLPLPVVANTRGGLGEYNSMIHTFSERVPDLLHALGVPVHVLDRRSPATDWGAVVSEAVRHAWMTSRPVVVLLDLWERVD